MSTDARPSREATSRLETHESLVDLLVPHIERSFVTAGQPGILTAVRDLFRRLDHAALASLAYELDLEAEPAAEASPEERP